MKIHLIAVGGSAMHNLAIALKEKGYTVSGSDDEIFEPSRSRLAAHGLLPDAAGWHPERIHGGLDAVILGMHARADNPELKRAQQLGLKIFSYPEYLYEQCRDKRRIVIGGSHGKTTITAMVMHILKSCGMDFGYMVGAQIDGFDTMVRLSKEAKISVFEGDEYLSSPIDPRPKYHLYHPNVALVSGIAWDHINVFPSFELYVMQFSRFIDLIEPGGTLVYCAADATLSRLVEEKRPPVTVIPYTAHPAVVRNRQTFLTTGDHMIGLSVFGEHNLQNIGGALQICRVLGVNDEDFYKHIGSFRGAARRLQTLAQNEHTHIFLDFAHSPSKLKATIKAVKEQYPDRLLTACMELHTFSSLSERFLAEYQHSMTDADDAWVYYNPETLKHKQLPMFDRQTVARAFDTPNVEVFTDLELLLRKIKETRWKDRNLLVMTSGNFNGTNFGKWELSGDKLVVVRE
ncbi:MAG: Mur ligase domain-containing protein [Bacteroidales bacterium]|nr:Mur ligase domain-containing protein [Bacteroidales bacterium]